MKKKELGKGIRALLNKTEKSYSSKPEEEKKSIVKELSNSIAFISPDSIEVNPFQPRTEFDETSLNELAESIRVHGIIQPITVRALGNNSYQIISGERRVRASKLAGIEEIPAYIRVADDQGLLEMAIIENIQRQDLNAMEIAFSYKRLLDECKLTHESLAERLGKNRSTVSNFLRLLKLPPKIQQALKEEKISMGHARSLITVDDISLQLDLLKKIIDQKWSVRRVESFLKSGSKKTTPAVNSTKNSDPHIANIQDELSAALGTKVVFKNKASGAGQISIAYKSVDELQHILNLIRSIPE